MMIRIAIVEDQQTEYDTLSRHLERYQKEKNIEIRSVWYKTAESFLEAYSSNYDLVLMDIALPAMSGMEAAAALRRIDQTVGLIFVTNLAQFAVKGYEVSAYDFIVKPVDYPDFSFKMDRFISYFEGKGGVKIIIESRARQTVILSTSIRYVEINGHTIIYHTTEGDFETYDTMKNVEAKLKDCGFARCNACYLVNLHFVDAVEGFDLLIGKERLIISHPRKKEFLTALNQYFGKGF